MNLYERLILSRVLDLVMRNKEGTRFRARIIPEARGATLEVGIGSGLDRSTCPSMAGRLSGSSPATLPRSFYGWR